MTIDRMKDINVFVHVAEAKSFTTAAEHIGLSRSAVGKSIVRLEDRLGVRLLQRTTRSVSLTGEGAAFHERCVRLLADLDEAEMSMLSHSQAPRGRLRLDLPVSFGRLHVLPILSEFMRKWPEISVSVSFNDRYVDLIDEGVDLAIRIGGSDDWRLMTRLLAPHRLVTCASPAYLESHGVPRTIERSRRPQLPRVHSWRTAGRMALQRKCANSFDRDQWSVCDDQCGGVARRDARRIRHRAARDLPDQRRSARRTIGPDSRARRCRRPADPRGISVEPTSLAEGSRLYRRTAGRMAA